MDDMNEKERRSLDELMDILTGSTDKQGFILEMRQFKDATHDNLTRLNFQVHELRQDLIKETTIVKEDMLKDLKDVRDEVKPIIDIVGHWKFISGLVLGLVGFILAIISIVWYIINLKT